MRLFARLYRLALGLLPGPFRARHGAEALRMAVSRVREDAGVRRLARACRELADLLLAVPRIRRESATPAAPGDLSSDRGGMMRNGWLSDFHHASRALLRSRGFVAIALGTLGAGIALCVTVMVMVNAYLVRGLPYPEADRLHWVRFSQPNGPFFEGLERLPWARLDDVFEHAISWDLDNFNLRGAPYPESTQGTWVTPGYMEGFGIRPSRGRAFQSDDYLPGGPLVAMISHRLWQTRFGGAPDIIGRRFEAYVSDRPDEPQAFTVVGVLPSDLWHLNPFTEVLAPLRGPSYPYMARLHRGVTPAVALERISALVGNGGIDLPDGWRVELQSAHDAYVTSIRPLLVSLATATALVLLIACANVAVLFTVRAAVRSREVAVRKALGASAGRVARSLASEAIVLGVGATVLGLGLAHGLLSMTAPLLERHLGRSAPGGAGALQIDGPTFAGGVLAGLLVTIVCCGAQLWASNRPSLALALGSGQKGASAGPQQRRAHAAMISIEVAVCLTLLVGATLTIQSGLRILGVDMGLDARDVLVGRLSLNQRAYPDAPSRSAFYERVSERAAAEPGAPVVAFANAWPLQSAPSRDVSADDATRVPATRAGMVAVSPAYFDALGIAVIDGRPFTSADRLGSERVAIVSRTLAARLWPGRRAVGERLSVAPPQGAAPGAPSASLLVIGVAGDVRHAHTDDDLADAYTAILQSPSAAAFMYVKAPGDAEKIERSMRAALAQVDPDMAPGAVRPLAAILDQQRVGSRFLASLLVAFALFAAVLALLGIYGVIAYTVRQREREIALRMAVGANRAAIARLFLRQGARVLAVGLLLGIGGALLLGRVLQAQLFGVQAADPVAIAAVSLAFAACGLAAIGWPARAAASTDPAIALKG